MATVALAAAAAAIATLLASLALGTTASTQRITAAKVQSSSLVPFAMSAVTSPWSASFCPAWNQAFNTSSPSLFQESPTLNYGLVPMAMGNSFSPTTGELVITWTNVVSCATDNFEFPVAPAGASWLYFAYYFASSTCNFTQSNATTTLFGYGPFGVIQAYQANGYCSPSPTARNVSGTLVPEYRKFDCTPGSSQATVTLCLDAACSANCTSETVSTDTRTNCALAASYSSALAVFSVGGFNVSSSYYTGLYMSAACLAGGTTGNFSSFQTLGAPSSSSVSQRAYSTTLAILVVVLWAVCFG